MKTKHDIIDSIPTAAEKYFWDCDISELSMREHHQFIIERILNFGDDDAVRWLFDHTNRAQIKNVLHNSRNLSEKTRNFWNIMMS
ncbi:MAG: hypothetical protein U5R06_04050 [candidate division KSB1 bacterium]|nr:hypothetical protein [candidate division KSB1 bacterium]